MSVEIRVYKRERRLEVWKDGECALQTHISLGFGADAGPKQREGDGRTPEGCYFICTKNASSKFFRSLGVSYPAERDARAALMRGEISPETYRAVEKAEAMRARPDWQSPLGGYIMLHGEDPDGRTGDWTAGCVALPNRCMEALFSMCEIGDGVVFLP